MNSKNLPTFLRQLAALGGILALGSLAQIPLQAQNAPSQWGAWQAWGDQGNGVYYNPVLPSDYSDIDCIRVGSNYYAISSTFQYSPGMIVLQSKDMVNWNIAGHAVPDITQISPEMNYTRMNRYGVGIWAGGIRFHDGKFWCYFGTPDEGYFMTTAPDVSGPWTPLTRVLASSGWDDCSPFWDDDGQGYLVGTNYANDYRTYIWKLSADGKKLLKQDGTPVSQNTDGVLVNQGSGREANKLYKVNGIYYHFFSEVFGGARVIMMQRSTTGPMGPYTERKQLTAGNNSANEPNQGGIVQAEDGKWYFYTHHGTGAWEGRADSLLPVTWVDGWPQIGTPDSNGLGLMTWSGAKPVADSPLATPKTSDEFSASSVSPQWEWNYAPRADKWSLTERAGWLRLKAFAPLSNNDLLKAGNTLTQRSFRTTYNEVITKLDLSGMANGQKAGLCHLSTNSPASFGASQSGTTRMLELKVGSTVTTGPTLTGNTLWLRSTWGSAGVSQFSYSTDGTSYANFGPTYQFNWSSYRGDRIGLYSYNNLSTAGQADFDFLRYAIQPPTADIVETNPGDGSVKLRWAQVREASGYQVNRATSSGGPYTPIGSATPGLVYTDNSVTNGVTYYYTITTVPIAPATATTSAAASAKPFSAVSINNALSVRLRFDETSGSTAADASGNNQSATLVNAPTRVAGKINSAVRLSGNEQHATLPTGVVSGLSGDYSITTWIRLTAAPSAWARVFDFGTGTNRYMFLTVKPGTSPNPRFAIKNGGDEQMLESDRALPVGVWTHLAITVSGNTATFYMDGNVVGTNTGMTLDPADLGSTTSNYLGRSQFSSDPYLNASLDEFQVADRAFSASEIAAMVSPPAPPSGLAAVPGNASVSLSWNTVNGAAYYNVSRSSSSNGPWSPVAETLMSPSYVDTTVANGSTYYYVVSTANTVAESARSAAVAASPVAPPGAPSGLSATSGDRQVALVWNAAGGATGYKIFRATTSGSNAPAFVGTTPGATSFTDSTAVNGTTYYYTVAGTKTGSQGAISNEASATASPPLSEAETAPPTVSVSPPNSKIEVAISILGHVYQLQFSDSLETESWQNLNSQVGNGGNLEFTTPLPEGTTKRFFRIVVSRM